MSTRPVLEELEARGVIAQVSDRPALAEALAKPGQSIYVGFDPTADSLHVGHMLPIMMLARLQQAGHRPIVLVGGATGMIGDPSGRSGERELLTRDQVAYNASCVREQLARFVSFEGDNAAVMVDNYDWTAPISLIEWLRDVGKHFTINYMLLKDSVKSRLGRAEGLSYTEFSYMMLQAYDFLHLFEAFDCRIQAGGNDQWGNITAGMDLIHRRHHKQAFAVTFPLVTTSTGEKFGKSAGNAVWLAADRTSPYQFYQYWMRVEDADVERYLKYFTFLPLEQIDEACARHRGEKEKRGAQRLLAEEITHIVHGEAALAGAKRATEALFGGDLDGLTAQDLADVFADAPSVSLPASDLDTGAVTAVSLLVAAGHAKSNGEARRLLQQNGAYVNNRPLADGAVLARTDLLPGDTLVVRKGKRSYAIVRFG